MQLKSFISPLMALILLAGCSTGADRSPYPAPGSEQEASRQRRDFVDSFLQGQWCACEDQYALSLESSLRTDDFCAAAKTAGLAARLREYVGLPADDLWNEARRYRDAALGCGAQDDLTERDKAYGALVKQGAFEALGKRLAAEEDSLFASVYARKGAREAIERGDTAQAGALIELARKRDARQGWVVFLREDWRLKLLIEDNPQQREHIHDRIRILDEQILPCD